MGPLFSLVVAGVSIFVEKSASPKLRFWVEMSFSSPEISHNGSLEYELNVIFFLGTVFNLYPLFSFNLWKKPKKVKKAQTCNFLPLISGCAVKIEKSYGVSHLYYLKLEDLSFSKWAYFLFQLNRFRFYDRFRKPSTFRKITAASVRRVLTNCGP